MPVAEDVYSKCDDLDNIPSGMRANYLREGELLSDMLPQNSSVLQVGSMDGERIIRLLKLRPDLQMTGLEIEEFFVKAANQKISKTGFKAEFIHGDITRPPKLEDFDYVICLNNTLGYIPDQQKALDGMKQLGGKVIVSVYGERFTDRLAKRYFDSIGLGINDIQGDVFMMKDFTSIRRYRMQDVSKWSSDLIETPVGYFCVMEARQKT
ncbi:MAG TPA: class I SAM-dependent methyltransferase [Candidatus Saccharimonadales bacterium]